MVESNIPLAEKLRPQTLDDVVGQNHLLGEDSFITNCVKADKPASIVLWGPPGCGKTTIARLYANAFKANFVQISAIFSGVADIKKVVKEAQGLHEMGQRTVLFVDEIHRFNKSQQDAFLPFVENGVIILVGATTENPSFELNNALLSRAQVLTLNALNEEGLELLLKSAEKAEDKLIPVSGRARTALLHLASGDGRYLLGLVESIYAANPAAPLDEEALGKLLQRKFAIYDKSGEGHYNLISALHKSIRGSDPDASLYWFCRMVAGGEDPVYIARRLVRMANEDIGLADPEAIHQATSAAEAYQNLGSPEGELALAQAVVYLALAPKSNALYKAFNTAMKSAHNSNQHNPPKIILNAPTKTMKELGYGDGYQYDHDKPNAFSGQDYFPDSLGRQKFYEPVERGFEREMKKRQSYFDGLREKISKN